MMRMSVVGQPASVMLYALEVGSEGAFVTLKLEGTSSDGFATLTPDQADSVAAELINQARVARSRSGLVVAHDG